jgi:hypothetical protein
VMGMPCADGSATDDGKTLGHNRNIKRNRRKKTPFLNLRFKLLLNFADLFKRISDWMLKKNI